MMATRLVQSQWIQILQEDIFAIEVDCCVITLHFTVQFPVNQHNTLIVNYLTQYSTHIDHINSLRWALNSTH